MAYAEELSSRKACQSLWHLHISFLTSGNGHTTCARALQLLWACMNLKAPAAQAGSSSISMKYITS